MAFKDSVVSFGFRVRGLGLGFRVLVKWRFSLVCDGLTLSCRTTYKGV